LTYFSTKVDHPALGAEQVAQPGGDDVLDRQLVGHLLHGMAEVVHHQQRAGIGVAELVLELARGVQRVDVDHGQAGAQRREDGHRILQAVGHHDRQAIALFQFQLALQVGGKLFGQGIDLGKGQFLVEAGQGRTIGETPGRISKHIGNGCILIHIDVCRDAGRIIGQPGAFVCHFPLQRKMVLSRGAIQLG
jgi:hypothetical protein